MPNTYEEYRYDALGRRVWVRTRQEWRCLERCQTTVRRVVWDGDHLLYEIQAPGGTGATAAEMEADVGLAPAVPAYSYESRTIYDSDAEAPPSDSVVTPQDGADGYYYGRVLYTHGGGMDAPLSITRMEYSDSLPQPMTVFLHRDWRGTHDLGTFAGGGTQPPCVTITVTKRLREPVEGQEPHGQDPPAGTPSEHCWDVDWPAPHVEITGRTYERSLVGAAGWSGSQIDGMRDASGLMYRRNRYYDPSSGRFTQEDPIGIAGGLNVYGFAEGDPVTYSDPYGLCAQGSDTIPAVQVCREVADLSVNPGDAKHWWLRTSEKEAGMGQEGGGIPGVGEDDLGDVSPFLFPTYVVDHSSRRGRPGVTCNAVQNVDAACVNARLNVGEELGYWSPINQCQQFVGRVLLSCATPSTRPMAQDATGWTTTTSEEENEN